MTSRKITRLLLISILPLFLLIIHLADLLEAIASPGAYPFGSAVNAPGSIYLSQATYIIYAVVQILALLLLIVLSFCRNTYNKAYFVCVVINVLLLLYPLITIRD